MFCNGNKSKDYLKIENGKIMVKKELTIQNYKK